MSSSVYHDQGHIPVKALAFDSAVNTTLGLPVIHASVDHGTALDIAWQGLAKPDSLYAAINLAVGCRMALPDEAIEESSSKSRICRAPDCSAFYRWVELHF